MLVLVSPADKPCVDLCYLDSLPHVDSPSYWDVSNSPTAYASTRCLLGEVLEQQGRWREAIEWGKADLNDCHQRNAPGKTRTGRLLGRCHAALGDHSLSAAALDASLATAKTGQLLLSEGDQSPTFSFVTHMPALGTQPLQPLLCRREHWWAKPPPVCQRTKAAAVRGTGPRTRGSSGSWR